MDTIIYLKRIPLAKKAFAIALMICGVLIFLTSNIFGGVMFSIIGLNLISTEGSEINLTNKTFRTINSVLGFKFGKWKPCPEFEYVSVFKTKKNTQINGFGATIGAFKTDVIVLNLFYDGNKHITFYKTDQIADAFKVAGNIKQALNIEIYDPAQLLQNS